MIRLLSSLNVSDIIDFANISFYRLPPSFDTSTFTSYLAKNHKNLLIILPQILHICDSNTFINNHKQVFSHLRGIHHLNFLQSIRKTLSQSSIIDSIVQACRDQESIWISNKTQSQDSISTMGSNSMDIEINSNDHGLKTSDISHISELIQKLSSLSYPETFKQINLISDVSALIIELRRLIISLVDPLDPYLLSPFSNFPKSNSTMPYTKPIRLISSLSRIPSHLIQLIPLILSYFYVSYGPEFLDIGPLALDKLILSLSLIENGEIIILSILFNLGSCIDLKSQIGSKLFFQSITTLIKYLEHLRGNNSQDHNSSNNRWPKLAKASDLNIDIFDSQKTMPLNSQSTQFQSESSVASRIEYILWKIAPFFCSLESGNAVRMRTELFESNVLLPLQVFISLYHSNDLDTFICTNMPSLTTTNKISSWSSFWQNTGFTELNTRLLSNGNAEFILDNLYSNIPQNTDMDVTNENITEHSSKSNECLPLSSTSDWIFSCQSSTNVFASIDCRVFLLNKGKQILKSLIEIIKIDISTPHTQIDIGYHEEILKRTEELSNLVRAYIALFTSFGLPTHLIEHNFFCQLCVCVAGFLCTLSFELFTGSSISPIHTSYTILNQIFVYGTILLVIASPYSDSVNTDRNTRWYGSLIATLTQMVKYFHHRNKVLSNNFEAISKMEQIQFLKQNTVNLNRFYSDGWTFFQLILLLFSKNIKQQILLACSFAVGKSLMDMNVNFLQNIQVFSSISTDYSEVEYLAPIKPFSTKQSQFTPTNITRKFHWLNLDLIPSQSSNIASSASEIQKVNIFWVWNSIFPNPSVLCDIILSHPNIGVFEQLFCSLDDYDNGIVQENLKSKSMVEILDMPSHSLDFSNKWVPGDVWLPWLNMLLLLFTFPKGNIENVKILSGTTKTHINTIPNLIWNHLKSLGYILSSKNEVKIHPIILNVFIEYADCLEKGTQTLQSLFQLTQALTVDENYLYDIQSKIQSSPRHEFQFLVFSLVFIIYWQHLENNRVLDIHMGFEEKTFYKGLSTFPASAGSTIHNETTENGANSSISSRSSISFIKSTEKTVTQLWAQITSGTTGLISPCVLFGPYSQNRYTLIASPRIKGVKNIAGKSIPLFSLFEPGIKSLLSYFNHIQTFKNDIFGFDPELIMLLPVNFKSKLVGSKNLFDLIILLTSSFSTLLEGRSIVFTDDISTTMNDQEIWLSIWNTFLTSIHSELAIAAIAATLLGIEYSTHSSTFKMTLNILHNHHNELLLNPLKLFEFNKKLLLFPKVFKCVFFTLLTTYIDRSRINVMYKLEEITSIEPKTKNKMRQDISLYKLEENAAIIQLFIVLLISLSSTDQTKQQSNNENEFINSSEIISKLNEGIILENQVTICSYIQSLFVDDAPLMELVHRQRYPIKAIPILCKHVPSMHYCLEIIPPHLTQFQFSKPEVSEFYIKLASYTVARFPTPQSQTFAKYILDLYKYAGLTVSGSLWSETILDIIRLAHVFPEVTAQCIEVITIHEDPSTFSTLPNTENQKFTSTSNLIKELFQNLVKYPGQPSIPSFDL